QSALVQGVDRAALDIEVTGLAHRTDQLAWLRVPDQLLFGPVRLPPELATMSLLELRQDHGEPRLARAATDRGAQRGERVRRLRSRRRSHARRGPGASRASSPPRAGNRPTRGRGRR